MKLPKIGDIVTTRQAYELCKHFGLKDVAERIKMNPDQFKPWKFDGCSGIPDQLLGLFTGLNWKKITYECCLPHDLSYAYGKPGDKLERRCVDIQFADDLQNKAGMGNDMAQIFFKAVQIMGREKFGLSFSWAFARVGGLNELD